MQNNEKVKIKKKSLALKICLYFQIKIKFLVYFIYNLV